MMRTSYRQILEVAEAHEIVVNIEPHGYFTTRPETMGRMLEFCDSPYLRMNMDTGNTFIAGQDPVAFLGQFIDRVSHVHVKDVSARWPPSTRGKQTGIAVSHCAAGRRRQRREHPQLPGPAPRPRLSRRIEHRVRRQGGPMIEQSLRWLRDTLQELGMVEETQ